MTAVPWRTTDDSVVLHAVRLAGFADPRGIAARAELPLGGVVRTLDGLGRAGLIQPFAFADAEGWILTDTGRVHDAAWLAEELRAARMRPVLEATVERFEPVNGDFVRVVTQWQLRPGTAGDDHPSELLSGLAEIAASLDDLMAVLAPQSPRFGRYPRQFRSALDRADGGDLDWVAGVGRLSCHIVWAELHEDLLSSLGRDRSTGPRAG